MHTAAVCEGAVCLSVVLALLFVLCLCVPHSALLPWDTATATSHPSGFHCLRQETCSFVGEESGTILQREKMTLSAEINRTAIIYPLKYILLSQFFTL